MASALQNLSTYDESALPDMSPFTFAIVVAEWNKDITHALYEGCYDTLIKHGVNPNRIITEQVPGTFELTSAAHALSSLKPDAVICLGCVIKGDTSHDEYINQAVAWGLTELSLKSGKPHIFGLLTVNTEEQALERAGGKHGNKGVEAAQTAIRMAALKKTPVRGSGKRPIGF